MPSPALGTQVSTGEVASHTQTGVPCGRNGGPGSDPRGWGCRGGGSVAVEFGGVGFRRVTAAAGWRRAASQEVTFSQEAWGEKTYGPGWDPMTPEAPSLASP